MPRTERLYFQTGLRCRRWCFNVRYQFVGLVGMLPTVYLEDRTARRASFVVVADVAHHVDESDRKALRLGFRTVRLPGSATSGLAGGPRESGDDPFLSKAVADCVDRQ